MGQCSSGLNRYERSKIEELVARLRDMDPTSEHIAWDANQVVHDISGYDTGAVIAAGAIRPLARLLGSPVVGMQVEAAEALVRLAGGGNSLVETIHILNAVDIRLVVRLLDSTFKPLQEKTVELVYALTVGCFHDDTLARALAGAGAIPPLVRMLDSRNDPVQTAAMNVLDNMAYNQGLREAIIAAGAIPPLLRCYHSVTHAVNPAKSALKHVWQDSPQKYDAARRKWEAARRDWQEEQQEQDDWQKREEAERQKRKQAAERQKREQVERQKQKQEAQRQRQEQAERHRREQAERQRQEQAELQRQEQVELQRQEQVERQKRKQEAQRHRQEQAERQRKEQAEQYKREQAERYKREQAERQRQEQAEQLQREEAERQRREEAERQAAAASRQRSDMPRKRALLVACSYKDSSRPLKGTLNDVRAIRRLLRDDFYFPSDGIMQLSDDMPVKSHPTRRNILSGFDWLMKDQKPGDSLFFYFSGHGDKQKGSGRYHQTICPLDYKANGVITDSEINRKIVYPLDMGVRLHALIDSCHSGTIMELPYNVNFAKLDSATPEHYGHQNQGYTPTVGTAGGFVAQFSAARHDQLAWEHNQLGAATDAFIQAIKSDPRQGSKLTYFDLLRAMNASLKAANRGQEAQMACNQKINTKRRIPFRL